MRIPKNIHTRSGDVDLSLISAVLGMAFRIKCEFRASSSSCGLMSFGIITLIALLFPDLASQGGRACGSCSHRAGVRSDVAFCVLQGCCARR